jgi:hypothetical protein
MDGCGFNSTGWLVIRATLVSGGDFSEQLLIGHRIELETAAILGLGDWEGDVSQMQSERQQEGNPHRLTIKQHRFPARGIARFAQQDGKVSLRLCQTNKQLRVRPDHEIFCGRRVWDQRAEVGYMKQVENDLQDLVDEILDGLPSLNAGKSDIVTKFFALWFLRTRSRHNANPGQVIKGIVGEVLSKDQEEVIESIGGVYVRSDQTMPTRFLVGLQIQRGIDEFVARFGGSHWGIVTAHESEFVLPDTPGQLMVLPVAPKVCLVYGSENLAIPRSGVAQVNRQAARSATRYLIARDFTQCPL